MECNADRFPEGLRVLVVDDDPICLLIVERLLRSCLYQVTTCEEAVIALSMLRENRSRFDVVISDVHMPNMDGFKLLELVRLEMDVPVIMMSANGETSSVMKGISQGACDYLLKPVRIEELQNIWQHVVRKKQTVSKGSGFAGTPKDCQQPRQIQADGETAVADEENGFCSSLKKRKEVKDEDTENEEEDNLGSVKRQRVVWSEGLHQKFVTAVNQLGLEQAVPKRILDLMNVPGLTRENVASHLQKFRLYLKRISGSVNQQAGMASCIEASIDSFAWINGHSDRQSVCQLPKLLVTPQLGPGGRLDAFNGGEMHCNESSPVNQLAAELRMDHRDLLMPQCFDPTFQGQGSVEPVLEDPINVRESEFMPSPGQLNTFSQNSSERLMLKQCHRVPHLRGSAFSGGLNYGEIGHSSTGRLSTHQFHVAQPQSQSNILSSLNGLAGQQQGFEEFSTESMHPPVDCCTKKGLENSGLFPPSRPNNDSFLFETFHRDSKSNSNAWPSAPSRTFTLTMPCLLEDASIFSIPKAVNEDEARWRMNNNFLSSSEMNTEMNNVKVVCPQLGRQFLRSQELELKEKEGPDLSLSMQAISGKQDVHASFMNVPSSNREKPSYSNSYADPGWSHAFHDAVVEELPTESVAVFKQDQVLR